MRVILMMFYITFATGRTTKRQSKNVEEEPFTVASDIFSDQFVVRDDVPIPQTFSEDDFEGELLKDQGISKQKLTGSLTSPLSFTVVNPPGVKPQLPGTRDDPTKNKSYNKVTEKVLDIKSLLSSLSSSPLLVTSFEVATGSEILINKTDLNKAHLNHSFIESSGETPTNNFLMTEQPNNSFITNTTEFFLNNESTNNVIDGSGDSDDVPNIFGRVIEKVSGEIGNDKECGGIMENRDSLDKVEPSSDKPTVSVEASLETSEGNMQNSKDIIDGSMLQRTDATSETMNDSKNRLDKTNSKSTIDEDSPMLKTHSLEIIVPILINPKSNRTHARRGAVEGTECACESDSDCPESLQLCDLGKCNCRLGYRQDMRQSGICEFDPDYTGPRDGEVSIDLSLHSLGVHAGELSMTEAAKAITDDDIMDEKEERKWNERKKEREKLMN
uniref:EB domain-containing protein n=1 Tax=Heterorhabditis bacteriophora TaxID=37862 RepID=A0A1I7XU57_HETBA